MKTLKTQYGEMLSAEAIDIVGIKDYDALVSCIDAMQLCLAGFHESSYKEGCCWSDDVAWGMTLFQDVISHLQSYRAAYLTRRVKALESRCGLVHNGDIDTPDVVGMDDGSHEAEQEHTAL